MSTYDHYDDILSPALCNPTPPRRSTSNNASFERKKLRAGDLCVGCIVWLPPKGPLDKSINCLKCPAREEMEDGAYNHPVVVLKIRQKENSTAQGDLVCDVANTTSFGSTPLSKYNTKRQYLEPSLPISQPGTDDNDGTPHPPTTIKQLHLEQPDPSRTKHMNKQSYVRLNHIYRVEISSLRTFAKNKTASAKECRAYKLRLDQESYGVLMHDLGLGHPTSPWEDSATLYETAARRLLELASSGGGTRHSWTSAVLQAQADSGSRLQSYNYNHTQQPQPQRIAYPPRTPHRVVSAPTHHTHTHTPPTTRTTTTSPYLQTRNPPLPAATSTYSPPSLPTHLHPAPPTRNYGTLHGYPATRRAEEYTHTRASYPQQRTYIPPSSGAHANAHGDGNGSGGGSWWSSLLVGVVVIGGLVWWSGWDGKLGMGLGWF